MKRRYIILLFLAALLALVFWKGGYIVNELVRRQFVRIVNLDEDRSYDIKIGKFTINSLEREVSVEAVELIPRAIARDSLEREQISALVNGYIQRAYLRNLDVLKLLLGTKVEVGKIGIESSRFIYYLNPEVRSVPGGSVLPEIFSDKMRSIRVEEIEIADVGFTLIDMSQDSLYAISVDSASLVLNKLYLDEETLGSAMPFRLDALDFHAGGFYGSILKDHDLKTGEIHVRTTREDTTFTLTLDSIRMIPRYDKFTFNRRNSHQREWIALDVEQLRIARYDLGNFFYEGQIRADHIEIIHPSLYIYKDKRLPDKPYKKRLTPSEALNTIPFPTKIDTVSVVDGRITFELQPDGPPGSGQLRITELYATGDNLSNDPDRLAEDPAMRLYARGTLMGQARTELQAVFPVGSPSAAFSMRGSMERTRFAAFNPFFVPTAYASFRSGTIQHLQFAFAGNRNGVEGTMDLHYEDLRVDVLKKPKELGEDTERSKFLSFSANRLIRKDNLPGKKNYRQGLIKKERTEDLPFIKFCVQSLGSGLISSLVPITKKSK